MVLRTWHTLRHLRLIQISDRILRRIPARLNPDHGDARLSIPDGPWALPPACAPILTGPSSVRIHELDRDIASRAAWSSGDVPALWLYHLHYFDDLVARGAAARRAWQTDLISRWIAENPHGMRPAWDPYPTSLRIVNWLKWVLGGGMMPAGAASSAAAQLAHLECSFEYHLLANHLFENAKALWFGGACFEGIAARRWLARGRDVVVEQLAEQVLPDGGHFEGSPMYHSRILENVLDLINVERASGRLPPLELTDAARRMLDWLAAMSHPDGNYALLSDAAFDQAHTVTALSTYAEALGLGPTLISPSSRYLADSGYVRLVRGPWVALIDVAPVGVDYQPAHGHADALTFELSLDGRRLVVDTGTSTYESGQRRRHQRSTAAHNTIQIAGLNSSEMWAAFRVGRRARIVTAEFSAAPGSVSVTGAHDGFARQGVPVIHRRNWNLSDERLHITDALQGGGVTSVVSSLHLHPDVRVDQLEATTFELSRDARTCAFVRLDGRLRWHAVSATYHPKFGVSHPNLAIVGEGNVNLPCELHAEIGRHNA